MQKAEKMQELRVFAQEIRVETLKTVGSLGFGHVPGAMSVIDALAVLYGEVMKVDPKNPHWEDRDWCVLSKGHAGPAMYATLGLKGFYPVEDAYTLNQPHTNFPSHTDRTKTPGVDLTTGSLGQGMSTRYRCCSGQQGSTARAAMYSYSLATASAMRARFGRLLSSQLTTSWTTSFAS